MSHAYRCTTRCRTCGAENSERRRWSRGLHVPGGERLAYQAALAMVSVSVDPDVVPRGYKLARPGSAVTGRPLRAEVGRINKRIRHTTIRGAQKQIQLSYRRSLVSG